MISFGIVVVVATNTEIERLRKQRQRGVCLINIHQEKKMNFGMIASQNYNFVFFLINFVLILPLNEIILLILKQVFEHNGCRCYYYRSIWIN